MNKNRTQKSSCLIALLVTGFAISSPATATYMFTELTPLSGGSRSEAFGINNLGQVVGSTSFNAACMGCGSTSRATLWDNTTAFGLGPSGNIHSRAMDINDSGQVVGTLSQKYTTSSDALFWNSTSGAAVSLPTYYYYDRAVAINNLGQIAGSGSYMSGTGSGIVWNGLMGTTYLGNGSVAVDINDAGLVAVNVPGGNGSNAAVWNGTSTTVLGTLSGGYSVAEAINNLGQVAGWSLTEGEYHATMWVGTMAIDLGTLGGHSSSALGINNAGHIVGTSTIAGGQSHAFLWDGTTLTDLNTLLDASVVSAGWVLEGANDINDHGQIVGTARNTITGQQSQAFLLTPAAVPEPETLAMVLTGLGLIGATTRRRKPLGT